MIRTYHAIFWIVMAFLAVVTIPPSVWTVLLIAFLMLVQQIESFDRLALIFVAMILGHLVADGPLQISFIDIFKNRYYNGTRTALLYRGFVIWPIVLGVHAGVHAGFVWLATGSALLGTSEFIAHALIDYCKGLGCYDRRVDQSLHVLCKIMWIVALAAAKQ